MRLCTEVSEDDVD